MERQFILRLPEKLKNVDTRDCKLTKISQREVAFCVGDKTYPGIICRLPTLVESQKYIDNKLYKIADVSMLVVVYENSNFTLEDEIRKHECSGLTPPMSYAKERRFNTTTIRTEEVEEIERRVAELLKEDATAMKVEVITNEKDSSDVDLDMFAAEIENDLPISKGSPKTSTSQDGQVLSESRASADKSFDTKLKDKKTTYMQHVSDGKPQDNQIYEKSVPEEQAPHALESTISPDKGISSNVVSLPLQSQTITSSIQQSMHNDLSSISEPSLEISISKKEENISQHRDEARAHPELIELENKIREKQEMFNKAVNPILKKRFEQSLMELKSEYEKKKNELV